MRLPLVIRSILGAVAVAAAPLVAVAQPQPNPVLDLARAREISNNPAAAAADLAAYADAHPDEARAGVLLGDLYFRIPDQNRAEAAWLRVVQSHPENVDAHARLGALYAVQGRLHEAITHYEADMPSPFAAAILVRLHGRNGDLDAFLFDTAHEADKNPFDPAVLMVEATVLQATRRNFEALGFYTRVVDLRHGTCEDLIARADDLLALHRPTDAIADLERCVAQDPAQYDAMALLGTAFLDQHDVPDARTWIDRALALNPLQYVALIDRGVIEDEAGAVQAAMSDNQSAIVAEPLHAEGYANLAGELLDDGALAVAERTLTAGLRAAPDDGRLHFLLARAYELEGHPAAARSEYVVALRSDEEVVVRAAQSQLRTLGAPPAK